MKWYLENDRTRPVITAKEHVKSAHGAEQAELPGTAVLFFMSGWDELLVSGRGCPVIMPKLPRFLMGKPVYALNERICFTDGGRGAPQAADTVETLHALGVKNVVIAGMFGVFTEELNVGDIAVPSRALIEEGTSLHYGRDEYSEPDGDLANQLAELLDAKRATIVSTDAVYRQTFRKEALWREQGAAGVDMETSAVLTVAGCLGMRAASVLIASDKHPMDETEPKWSWSIDRPIRHAFIERVVAAAEKLF